MQQPPDQKNYAQQLAVWVLVFMVGAVLLASTYSMGDASPGTDGGGSASGALAWAGASGAGSSTAATTRAAWA